MIRISQVDGNISIELLAHCSMHESADTIVIRLQLALYSDQLSHDRDTMGDLRLFRLQRATVTSVRHFLQCPATIGARRRSFFLTLCPLHGQPRRPASWPSFFNAIMFNLCVLIPLLPYNAI